MIRFAAAAALLALPQVVAAQTPCLTRQEVRTLIAFTAPSVIDAASRRCGPTLPADAFLRTDAPAMIERLRGESRAEAQGVTAVMEKLAGDKLPQGLSEETMRGLIRDTLGAEISKDINPKDCSLINELTASLSPLPAANIATMVSVILELGGSDKKAPFRICES
jgi:hypothetical protein